MKHREHLHQVNVCLIDLGQFVQSLDLLLIDTAFQNLFDIFTILNYSIKNVDDSAVDFFIFRIFFFPWKF